MIWLTWRQHRREAFFALGALAVLGAFLAASGLAVRNAFENYGLPDCVARLSESGPGLGESCNRAFNQFSDQFNILNFVGVLLLALPLVVGLFWGAPLVAREVEQGTHRLVWTQGPAGGAGRW